MSRAGNVRPYRDRMGSIAADAEFEILEKKYQPFLEMHGIEDIFGVFDIVQAQPEDAVTGKLIWIQERDLRIELKKDITRIFNRHFVD